METLHLSYQEVVYQIPYRNLTMLNADKLRVIYGDREQTEINQLSGKEIMKQKTV